jgi:hypothetical protein
VDSDVNTSHANACFMRPVLDGKVQAPVIGKI